MKKQKKQSALSTLIVILLIVLIMMVGSIVYEEKINMNKQEAQNTIQQNEKDDAETNKIQTSDKEELEDEEPEEEEQEYVGEEENNTEKETTLSKDEKTIDLVKKEWGDDESVTFSIVDKSGSKYRVSVISESTAVLQWYEVDTETWEVSEF